MCGLYGVFCYGEPFVQKIIKPLITGLGNAAMKRGIDATGIAYVQDRFVVSQKSAIAARDFKVHLPKYTSAVMGHTRLTLQGNASNNFNNHPFEFEFNGISGALAHNGYIPNDKILRQERNLPDTKIETDSYVAVQLLEAENKLDTMSIKQMCVQLNGTYCFSILDGSNNLYLVKGNNPLYMLHHKALKLYIYASTKKVLWDGILGSELFNQHFKPHYQAFNTEFSALNEISVLGGQIVKINSNGFMEQEFIAA